MRNKHLIPLVAASFLMALSPCMAIPQPIATSVSTAESITRRPAMHLTDTVNLGDVNVTVTYSVVSGRISGILSKSYAIIGAGISNVNINVYIQEHGARAQVVATYHKNGFGTKTAFNYIYP